MEPACHGRDRPEPAARTTRSFDQRRCCVLTSKKKQNRNFGGNALRRSCRSDDPGRGAPPGDPAGGKCNAVARGEQRARRCAMCSGTLGEASGFGLASGAIVTAGGVSVREINPKTHMQPGSGVPRLYFGGGSLTSTPIRAASTRRLCSPPAAPDQIYKKRKNQHYVCYCD